MISYEEGYEFAKKHDILFVECSAKSSKNIEPVFTLVAEEVVRKIEKEEVNYKDKSSGIQIGPDQGAKKESKGGCC